jgi:phosphonate dehydrogenase
VGACRESGPVHSFRLAGPDDAADLLALQHRLDGQSSFMLLEPGERELHPGGVAARLQAQGSSGSFDLVAVETGGLTGWLSVDVLPFRRASHNGYVVMGVDAGAAGHGIEGGLLAAADREAGCRGLLRLELTVMADNLRALGLYLRNAMPGDRRPAYHPGNFHRPDTPARPGARRKHSARPRTELSMDRICARGDGSLGGGEVVAERLPQVVVTHWVHPEVQAYLEEFSTPVIPPEDQGVWVPARVLELAGEAEALIACMADRVDDAFLADCPGLRIIAATLKGYDNFDAAACARRGVWLTIVPDIIVPPTAELAVGLAIGIMRRVGEADRAVRATGFEGWRPWLYGLSLAGATAGIVGMGDLGQSIARLLRAFGSRIVYADPRPLPPGGELELAATRVGLGDLMSTSDVIIVTAPLTQATRGLLGADMLRLARAGAFVVNVGRGSVVDERAVAEALDQNGLGGYAADVFAMEDWALPGHPAAIPAGLLRHPRTLFTPHLGSAAERQVRQALNGHRPDHAVNEPFPR